VLALRKGNTTLDPLTRRRQTQQQARVDAAKSFSFRDCAEAFMAAKAPEWRNPIHARQWPQSLRDYAYPAIGDLPVAAIDTGLIMRVIEPLWQTKTETANRTRSRIEAVLDYARSQGYREGENPARWRGHIQHMLPRRSKVQAVEHFLALPYGQIQTFIVELRRQESVAARALEFLTLTAARAGEVIGARWGEINVGEKLWSIPASRMKSGKPHAVPLSDAGMAVIEQTGSRNRAGTDRIFPRNTAGDALSPPAMRRVLADIGFADRTSVHGLRSTFSSWAAALSTAPHEVIEMQLAHAVGDAVVRAYQRDALLAKRRALV